jgi:hypothetical protein
MTFIYNKALGCAVYNPLLTGFELKHNYFVISEECKNSLIYLQRWAIESNGREIFNWANLVTVADQIGLPSEQLVNS